MTVVANFFRSMSLAEDLEHIERFLHFRPTSRSLPIARAVTEAGGCSIVIAPYGSGKSLAAGLGALFVRNDPDLERHLRELSKRMQRVDARLAAGLDERVTAGRRGAVVILSGLVEDPIAAIAVGLGMTHRPKTVEGFTKTMREGGWDHVAIVWDEFGRHLEGLVAEGRSSELDLVQRLAERTARASGPTMSLTLLLHQNLMSYATRLTETSRSEWRKIEGRFSALRIIEDSQEFFELVGEVVSGLGPEHRVYKGTADIAAISQAAISAGWFGSMGDPDRVARMLLMAQPLTVGALQVLPTLVARVGQNERSIFSFLREQDLSQCVGIEQVYTSFSDAMRSDVGIGGTYRRWVETESARSRADSGLKRELLAAACLLQLGGSGERRRVPRQVLELAVAPNYRKTEVSAAFDELVRSRLLLWRQQNDDVAVWHGADVDVGARVREERDRRSSEFDLKSFLDLRFPAPHVRATGHNAHFGVNRFLEGRYLLPSEIPNIPPISHTKSGVVGYVLAQNRAELAAARKAARAGDLERMLLVVPSRPLDIEAAALELVALEALAQDREFLASDPMIATEIDELKSVAFEQLARLMRSLLDPGGLTARWHSRGEELDVSPERPASVAASRLLNAWFANTPRIANEQLMRAQASRTMQTARVRVVSSILERADRPSLGYTADDGSAEASIFRTVLERTGLRPPGSVMFSDIEQLADGGLKEVWTRIGTFFRSPTREATELFRPLSQLLDELAAPPIGLPAAVTSLLVAAGYRHFARAVAIYRDGTYLQDVLGFQFDAMVSAPEPYQVRVLELTEELRAYLAELCYIFSHERPANDDELVRRAFDAMRAWLLTVPDGSKRSGRLSDGARTMLRLIGLMSDPIDLLLRQIPEAFRAEHTGPELLKEIDRARLEIDSLRDAYADDAVLVIRESFERYASSPGAVDAIKAWAGCFSPEALVGSSALRLVDLSVLRKATETSNGRFSDKSLANSLSSILLQRSLDKWDDRTADQFRTALREARDRIESAALETRHPEPKLRPIILAKLSKLNKMLAKVDAVTDKESGSFRVSGGAR
jgi:hypothetical protein